MRRQLTVREASVAAVTDLGRVRGPGFGLPINGALDQYSARTANILCANPEDAPLIEITAFDFAFTTDADVLIAITGADMHVTIDQVPAPMWEPVPVAAGQEVRLSQMLHGMRCYIAVHGSFEVESLLGSCAPDTVIEFGTVLAKGSTLTLAGNPLPPNRFLGQSLFNLGIHPPYLAGPAVIDVIDGPDIDDFGSTAYRLFDGSFSVLPDSNHIGLRLAGGTLPERTSAEEKISRGVPVGAVEVPPGDELLILHRGRGVTAGYPVLGVVTTTSLDALGQVRPGQAVSFRRLDASDAMADTRYWRDVLNDLTERVATVFACLGMTAHLGLPAPEPDAR